MITTFLASHVTRPVALGLLLLLSMIQIGCDYSIVEIPEKQRVLRVTVTPNEATLNTGASIDMTATVQNPSRDSSVTWGFDGAALGTLTVSGNTVRYLAPSEILVSPTTVTLLARSKEDTSKVARAVITLLRADSNGNGGPVTLSLTPLSVTLNPGQTQQFSATVTSSTNTGVTWKLLSGPGEISTSGLYTAPPSITMDQVAIIEVKADADATVFRQARITITQPTDPNLVCFERDVLPIFINNCTMCHGNEVQEEGLNFTTYQGILRGFGDDQKPEENDILEKITDDDPRDLMPPPPRKPLSAEQIETIRKWIQQGAKNTACNTNPAQCDTTNVTYANFVRGVMETNCTGCHTGAGAYNNNVDLSTQAGVKAVALDNNRLMSAIDHSGQFDMPKGGQKLDDCTIDKIRAWIRRGAN